MIFSSLLVVVHASLSTQEEEAGRSLSICGQSGLLSYFQDSKGNTENPCLLKQIKKLFLVDILKVKS